MRHTTSPAPLTFEAARSIAAMAIAKGWLKKPDPTQAVNIQAFLSAKSHRRLKELRPQSQLVCSEAGPNV